MAARRVTALIGPSGCGKSTFLRILNRMHELIPGAAIAGQVVLDGDDIYGQAMSATAGADADRHGVPEAEPVPGDDDRRQRARRARSSRGRSVADRDELVEECLTPAGLWNEVKDRLHEGGMSLSGGQQQRLCIARALAVRPQVLLMDEPCSALDPISTRVIEETIAELAHEVTIVIVTHNMQQAARVSDQCAFFLVEDDDGAGPHRRVGRDREDVRRARRPAHARLRHRPVRMSAASAALRVAAVALRRWSSCRLLASLGPGCARGRRDARSPAAARRSPRSRSTSGGPTPPASRTRSQVNYVSQGSTFGRQEFIEGNLDYGASDITFQPTELPAAPGAALRRAARRHRMLRVRAGERRRARVHVQPHRQLRATASRTSSSPAGPPARSSPARSRGGTTPRSSRPTRSSRGSAATSSR